MWRFPLKGQLRFWHILSLIFSATILVFGISTSIVITRISNESLYDRIINEGKQLTGALANQSKLALLYDSETTAKEVEAFFLAFTDVIGIHIIRSDFSTLYKSDSNLPAANPGAFTVNAISLTFEDDAILEYAAPVYAGAAGDDEISPFGEASHRELIGYVLLVQSKDALKEISGSFLRTNLTFSLGSALFLMLLLLYVTARLTQPLAELARTMQLSRTGAQKPRIKPHGTRDIVEMQSAFNNMMDRLDAHESELKKARDEAYQLAKVKSDFAANVSHELRTPLNGILGMLELMDTETLGFEQARNIKLAKESAQDLLVLINNVLDFSRNEAGSIELNEKEFYLEEHLAGIINLLSVQVRKKGIDLTYRITQNPEYSLLGDDVRLRQILINLVGNAIKFTHTGTVAIQASVTELSETTAELTVVVADTGIGISDSQQTKIFEAFSQADNSTTRRYGGSGLGLAISKQLVMLLGGQMRLASEPGRGSKFSFTVPLKRGAPPAKYVTRPDFRGKVALVVEPNPEIFASLVFFLQDSGMTLHNASSADMAAAMIREWRTDSVDLIILDAAAGYEHILPLILLPQLNRARVLVLTHQTADASTSALKPPAEYLPKPLTRNLVLNTIGRLFLQPPVATLSAQKRLSGRTALNLSGRRVLVVEDNPVNKLVAQGYLEPFGCEVVCADNGLESLSVLRSQAVDLVFMDCQMPVMDGFEATRRIRAGEAGPVDIPIIAMTANVASSDRDKCLEAGMNGFVGKPITINNLTQTLQNWLSDISLLDNQDTFTPKDLNVKR